MADEYLDKSETRQMVCDLRVEMLEKLSAIERRFQEQNSKTKEESLKTYNEMSYMRRDISQEIGEIRGTMLKLATDFSEMGTRLSETLAEVTQQIKSLSDTCENLTGK